MAVKIDQVREDKEQLTSPEAMSDIWKAMDKVRILAISSLAALGISTWAAMAEQQKPIEVADASGKILSIALKENPHVPAGLRAAIMQEAIANGADEDFDIPWLEQFLDTLAETGDLPINQLKTLLKLSPTEGPRLPLVIALIDSESELALKKEWNQALKEIIDALREKS